MWKKKNRWNVKVGEIHASFDVKNESFLPIIFRKNVLLEGKPRSTRRNRESNKNATAAIKMYSIIRLVVRTTMPVLLFLGVLDFLPLVRFILRCSTLKTFIRSAFFSLVSLTSKQVLCIRHVWCKTLTGGYTQSYLSRRI